MPASKAEDRDEYAIAAPRRRPAEPLAHSGGALEGAGYRGAYDLRLTSQRCRDANYDDLLRDCLSAVRHTLPALLVDSSAAPVRADLPAAALHVTSAIVPPR